MKSPTKLEGGGVMRSTGIEQEAVRLFGLARRVANRLNRAIANLPKDGIPDEDMRETLDWYRRTIVDLLREQRERMRIAQKSGLSTISDLDLNAELEQQLRAHLATMTSDEIAGLLSRPDGTASESTGMVPGEIPGRDLGATERHETPAGIDSTGQGHGDDIDI